MSNELSRATDDLNAAFCAFEEALRLKNLGVRARVELPIQVPPGPRHFLGFGKEKQRWILTYEFEPADSGVVEIAPLCTASRQTRLAAARALGRLHEALIAEAAGALVEVHRARECVEAFTQAVLREPARRASGETEP